MTENNNLIQRQDTKEFLVIRPTPDVKHGWTKDPGDATILTGGTESFVLPDVRTEFPGVSITVVEAP